MAMRIPTVERVPGTRDQWKFRKYLKKDPASSTKRPSIVVWVQGRKADAVEVARQVTRRAKAGAYDPKDRSTLVSGEYEGGISVTTRTDGSLHIVHQRRTTGTRISTLAQEYLDSRQYQKLATKTRTDYASIIRTHINPLFGDLPVGALVPTHVQDVLDSMLEDGYSASARQHVRQVLSNILKTAVRAGRAHQNVVTDVEKPASDETSGRAMSLEEVKTYLAHLGSGPEDRALYCALMTGMRPSELLALQQQDVTDRGDGCVFNVVRALEPSYSGGSVATKPPKNQGSIRPVSLPRTNAERILDGAGTKWLFTRHNGNPLTVAELREYHYHVLEKAGLDRYRLYDLRHTHITLLQWYASALMVSKRAGHRSQHSLVTVYGHPDHQQQLDGMAGINESLGL